MPREKNNSSVLMDLSMMLDCHIRMQPVVRNLFRWIILDSITLQESIVNNIWCIWSFSLHQYIPARSYNFTNMNTARPLQHDISTRSTEMSYRIDGVHTNSVSVFDGPDGTGRSLIYLGRAHPKNQTDEFVPLWHRMLRSLLPRTLRPADLTCDEVHIISKQTSIIKPLSRSSIDKRKSNWLAIVLTVKIYERDLEHVCFSL
jgi:hypothetical protein